MKPKRVQCDSCQNFIWPELDKHGLTKTKAKCQLGKRIFFRLPARFHINEDDWGWIRYCYEFKSIKS